MLDDVRFCNLNTLPRNTVFFAYFKKLRYVLFVAILLLNLNERQEFSQRSL